MVEVLKRTAKIDLVQVPYKGERPALSDLMGGRIDQAFGFPAGAIGHVRARKLHAIAITSEKRVAAFADISTLAESAVPGYAVVTLSGYVAPRGTLRAVIRKLNDGWREAVQSLKSEIEQRGAEIIASSPEAAATMLKSEYAW